MEAASVPSAGNPVDPVVVPDPSDTTSARILGGVARAPLNLLLLAIGLLWLVPTIGLFFTSLLAPENFNSGGWWQVLLEAERRDLEQLLEPVERDQHPALARDDARDRDRRHGAADPRRRVRRLRVRLARLPRAATGCSSASSACWWCRCRWR